MHTSTLQNWQHSHLFSLKNERGEQRTQLVLILTLLTMTAEIIAGTVFGSMALLADGWHMGTQIAVFAYRHARKYQHSSAYSFGVGKVEVLAGFASAVALVALLMLAESLVRLAAPEEIRFNEAITVAFIGLAVNVVSAFLLKDGHYHHEYGHGHDHNHDQNLRAAYLHVLADALTSVLAIIALLAGKFFGWHWLDPLMGMVGAAVITIWALGLLKEIVPVRTYLKKTKQNNRACKQQERQEIISMPLISDNQPSKVLQPSEKPLDFPATLISPQFPSVLSFWLRAVAAVRRNHLNTLLFQKIIIKFVTVMNLSQKERSKITEQATSRKDKKLSA